MIYVIARSYDEIKYDHEGFKVIINTSTDDIRADIAAWPKIYEDAKRNGYKYVGIYQARRAFHIDDKVMHENEFDTSTADVFVTKFECTTMLEQYQRSHPEFKDVLEKVVPKEYLEHVNDDYLYPHNMFYVDFSTFEKVYHFIMKMCDEIDALHLQTEDKIASYVSERAISLWFMKNFSEDRIHVCRCLRFNKETGIIDARENGL